MSTLNLVLWGLGIVLVVLGWLRARGPWSRYQALKAQQENIDRYESWRGSRLRDDGPSAASVMMDESRRQALVWAAISVAGVVVLLAGFAVH